MNKGLDIVSKIVCVFISIILFFVICMYLSLSLVPKIINKENVTNIVKEVDAKDILENNETSVIDDLYEIADNSNIDRKVVNGIVNSKEFKELVGNYYGEIVDSLLYNGQMNDISSNQIISTVEDILDRSSSDLGYSITEEQRKIIMIQVEEKAPQIASFFPTYNQITEELNTQDIKAIQTVLGNDSKMILIVVIVVLFGIIALLRWSAYRFAIWTGTTTIVAGGFFVVIGLLGNSAILNLTTDQLSTTINSFLQTNVFNVIMNTGLMAVIIGIVQIIYYVIMKKT